MRCLNKSLLTLLLASSSIGFTGTAHARQETTNSLDDIITRVEAAKHNYENARQIYANVKNDVEKTRAGKLLADAEYEYATSADELDRARIQLLAQGSGLAPGEIAAMRIGGKGWGAIARTVGVQPDVLGRGHEDATPPGPARGRGADRTEN